MLKELFDHEDSRDGRDGKALGSDPKHPGSTPGPSAIYDAIVAQAYILIAVIDAGFWDGSFTINEEAQHLEDLLSRLPEAQTEEPRSSNPSDEGSSPSGESTFPAFGEVSPVGEPMHAEE